METGIKDMGNSGGVLGVSGLVQECPEVSRVVSAGVLEVSHVSREVTFVSR